MYRDLGPSTTAPPCFSGGSRIVICSGVTGSTLPLLLFHITLGNETLCCIIDPWVFHSGLVCALSLAIALLPPDVKQV